MSYFKVTEFDSKDGAEMPLEILGNVQQLIANLNVIREELGSPLYVNSGYRSPEHNKKVKGGSNSQHLKGKAADLRSNDFTPEEVGQVIQRLIDEKKISEGGLSVYDTFVHYDIRGTKARW